jgi:AraC-like DNA-binding protein
LVRTENLLNNYERRIAWKEYLTETDTDKPVATPIVIEEAYEWLQQVENIVKTGISNYMFSIDFLAEELNMSKRQLYRKIKTATGLTPNQYIQEIRLQKVNELLEENTTITLKELSYAVGFSTPNYLNQLYQKRFGKSLKERLEN